jgi:hypothetical protein
VPLIRRRAGRVVPALAVTVALTLLAACSPTPSPSPSARTAPDAVELAAVRRTALAFGPDSDGGRLSGDNSLTWVQLWTSTQFPTQMQNCAAGESNGQLALSITKPELGASIYRIVGSGSHPNEAEAALIIQRCAAATPLDDRVLRLGTGEWDALYSYELTTLRPCLLAHGFSVHAAPSRSDFERSLRAQKPWSPYDTVIVTSRAAWYALSDACPPLTAALNSAVSPG